MKTKMQKQPICGRKAHRTSFCTLIRIYIIIFCFGSDVDYSDNDTDIDHPNAHDGINDDDDNVYNGVWKTIMLSHQIALTWLQLKS